MGIFIFILSVYLLEHEISSNLSDGHGETTISLVIVLIIIKFVWESFVTQSEIRSYFHIQRSILRNNLIKPFVQPGFNEREAGFETVEIPGNKADLMFSSKAVNSHIRLTPISFTLSEKKNQHIKKYIQTHREILLQYLNHYFFTSLHTNRQFTNDRKLCLSTDLGLTSKHVVCHSGGYYDSFLTNQVSGTTLIIKDKAHTTITTEHIFPSKTGDDGIKYLNNLSSSQMNDHIGISTIGFTSDHFILIWAQGSTNQFSKDLIIPTGSGSVNFSDNQMHNLQKTLVTAMERELGEETVYIAPQDFALQKTIVLGFFRWATRAGKPEFTGITKLPGSSDQYTPNPKEIRTDHSSQLKFHVDTIDDLPSIISKIKSKDRVSVPLFMCLIHLEEMYKNQKKDLDEFLFGTNKGA